MRDAELNGQGEKEDLRSIHHELNRTDMIARITEMSPTEFILRPAERGIDNDGLKMKKF
jgi:hypothetical protein